MDTVLFDLDGTLLPFNQNDFIAAYFAEIKNVFAGLGLDAALAVRALWAGTDAMIRNDGTKTNAERFWEVFERMMGLSGEARAAVETACDGFYTHEFDTVKAVLRGETELSRQLVCAATERGFTVALATNPLFPACAVETRLGWAGLAPADFQLITDYANSSYCKPNPGYYREIFKKLGKEPSQCLMIGNNPRDDMAAGLLGAEVFLVTDYLENETSMDISTFRHGTLAEAMALLQL